MTRKLSQKEQMAYSTIARLEAERDQLQRDLTARDDQLAERDALHPIRVLGQEAYSTLVGMVEFCLNKRVCLGMDEGYKNFLDEEDEHDFVKELRTFVALSASTEPSAPPEQSEWHPLTAPGQIQEGDRLSFKVGSSFICARARQIIAPGTDKEEVVYNRKKNHYFLTSMAVDGTSSHKNVMVARVTA
jgi:hypothetical protein